MSGLDSLPAFDTALYGATRPATPTRFVPDGQRGIPLGGNSVAQKAAVKKAAQDFEAFFVTSMLESMSAGVKPDKMFGGGQGESMYRSLMNQEYGKAIAKQGSLGIADAIEREMLKMQEAAK